MTPGSANDDPEVDFPHALLDPLRTRIPAGWRPHLKVPRGWWQVLHLLDADLATIDPRYELRRAARVDNTLVYLTSTTTEQPAFARRIGRAQAAERAVCTVCGQPGEPRTRSHTVQCELHWHPLTAAERAFALGANIPAAWFGDDAEAANEAYIAACEAKDRKDAAAHLTEREMADVLNVTVQRVHEMFEPDLLAGADREGRIVYPRWQLAHDGRLLRHLAAVLERLTIWIQDLSRRSWKAWTRNLTACHRRVGSRKGAGGSQSYNPSRNRGGRDIS